MSGVARTTERLASSPGGSASGLHDEAILADALDSRSDLAARPREPRGDPVGVGAPRQRRLAESEVERHELELGIAARPPEGEDPQVVAELGVHGVVVE